MKKSVIFHESPIDEPNAPQKTSTPVKDLFERSFQNKFDSTYKVNAREDEMMKEVGVRRSMAEAQRPSNFIPITGQDRNQVTEQDKDYSQRISYKEAIEGQIQNKTNDHTTRVLIFFLLCSYLFPYPMEAGRALR